MNLQPITRRSPDSDEHLDPWPLRGRAVGEIVVSYVILTAIGLLLGWILLGPLSDTALADWDESIALWFAEQRTETMNVWSNVASALSDTYTIIIGLLILVPTFAWVWKRWRESLTLGIGLALESLVFLTVSLTVGRDRPPVEQLDASPPTASFPSGHTGAAFAFYWAIALIVYWNTDNKVLRAIFTTIAIVIPPLVAISRMYRGMHFITDVTVGATLGVVCTLVAAYIVTRAVDRHAESEEPA